MDDKSICPNPVEILLNCAEDYKLLAESMRVSSVDPRDNDIPDIFELAANLITSITLSKHGYNPDVTVLQMTADIDNRFLNNEREFLKKMEAQMNKIAQKVDDVQAEINAKEKEYRREISELPEFFNDILKKLEVKRNEKIKRIKEDIDKEIANEKEKHELAKEEIAKDISNRIQAYINEWETKIKKTDEDVEALQKELQTTLHMKHQYIQIKNEEIKKREMEKQALEDNLRMELESKREDCVKRNNQLRETLKNIESLITVQNEKLNKLILSNQKEFETTRNNILSENEKEIEALSSEFESLSQRAAELYNEVNEKRRENMYMVVQMEKDADERLKRVREETEELIQKTIRELESQYQPCIDMLTAQVQEAEKDRLLSLEELRKSSLQSVEERESEIIEINKHHQDTRSKLLAVLRKEKQKLQEMLMKRGKSIEELKESYNKTLKEQCEQLERNYADHQARMRELIERINEETILANQEEERNRALRETKRKEEIEKLGKEHEQKMQDLQFKHEMQLKVESERAYLQGVAEANEQHQREITNIKTRIKSLHEELSSKQKAYDTLKERCERELREYKYRLDDEYNSKIKQLKVNHNEDIKELEDKKSHIEGLIADLQQQIKHTNEQAEKYYIESMTVKHANEQVEKCNVEHTTAKPGKESNEKLNDDHKYDIKVSELRCLESELNLKLRDLKEQQLAIDKDYSTYQKHSKTIEEELETYNEKFEENLRIQLADIKEQFDKLLSIERSKIVEFEEDSAKEKENLQNLIKKQEELFKESQNNLNATILQLENDRETQIANLEEALNKKFNEELEELQRQHEIEIKELKEKVDQIKKERAANISEIERYYEREFDKVKADQNKTLQDLETEQDDLQVQVEALKYKIKLVKYRQCPECQAKQEVIDRLRVKREEIQNQFEETTKQNIQTDQRLNAIFQNSAQQQSGRKVGTLSSLTIAAPRSSINLSRNSNVVRSKSSAKKPVIIPPK